MGTTERTDIVSSTPRRTRIKVSAKRRYEEEIHRLAHRIKADPRVHHVRTDVRTGSIIVHHEPDALSGIHSTLQDLGVILASTTTLSGFEEGESRITSSLTDALGDLNSRLGLASNGLLDLRLIVPLGLGVLAGLQLMRRGLQVETAPWYVLAYLAFDSFVKLNTTTGNTPAEDDYPEEAGD